MKRGYICIVALLLLLSACVPTPEKEYIYGDAETNGLDRNTFNAHSEEYPSEIQEVLVENENCKITINAQVNAPASTEYSIDVLEKSSLTDTLFEQLIHFFSNNSEFYEINNERTKDVIETEMRECVDVMNQTNPDSDDYIEAKTEFEQLQLEYNSAPEKPQNKKLIKAELLPASENPGAKEFSGWFYQDDERYSCNVITGRTYNWFTIKCLAAERDYYILENPEMENLTKDFPEDEARKLADEIIQKIAPRMAFDGMQCYWNSDMSNCTYVFIYRPAVNGIPVHKRQVVQRTEEIPYADSRWKGDTIKVSIDKYGLVMFSWNDFSIYKGTSSSNNRLLPFSEILTIAEQQLKNTFVWNEEGSSIEYYVDRIALEYDCVMNKDHADSFLLVPVWNFYGGAKIHDPELGIIEQYGYRADIVLVSIQALNGRVISS